MNTSKTNHGAGDADGMIAPVCFGDRGLSFRWGLFIFTVCKRHSVHLQQRFPGLWGERSRWLGFLRSRGARPDEAEDLLQSALVKAFEKIDTVRSEEDAGAWFYRVLRNTLTDHFRKQVVDQKRLAALVAEQESRGEDVARPSAVTQTSVCQCVLARLDELNARYADLIRKIDLEEASPATVAEERVESVGSVNVALHRARRALRRELESFCRECATDGSCLDCGCSHEKAPDQV